MGATTFLTLDKAILPPPLPAVVAVLVTTGLVALGSILARAIRRQDPEWIDRAAGFFAVSGLVGAATHALALVGLARVSVLRPLGLGLAAVGAAAIWKHGRGWGAGLVRRLREDGADLDWLDRVGLAAAILTVVGLSLAALGPPTDADSLEYHLGVPLDWLRRGGAYPRADWFHVRLVGLGEALNLLGLASGTDTLGAALQAASLVLLVAVAAGFGEGRRERLLALLLVAACPVMAFLVPNQKPQLMPSAAIATAALMAVRRRERFGPGDALLASGAIGLAAGSKYSMLLTATVATLLVLWVAWRNGCAREALASGFLTLVAFPMPVYARNLAWYGDPLSPFLERFRAVPDSALVTFAAYLREGGGDVTPARLLQLPLELLVPRSPGELTTVLGLGTLAFLAGVGNRRAGVRVLLGGALGASILQLVFGQVASRFFLEPYVWAGVAAVVSQDGHSSSALRRALAVQAVVVCGIAVFGMAQLLPGAMTLAQRDQVMRRAALGYEEARWLDQVLPRGAVLLSSNRTRALTPRPFVSTDRANWAGNEEMAAWELAALVRLFKPNALTLYAGRPPAYQELERACGTPLAGPVFMRYAVRNPLHLGHPYYVRVVTLDLSLPACQRFLLGPAPGANSTSQ